MSTLLSVLSPAIDIVNFQRNLRDAWRLISVLQQQHLVADATALYCVLGLGLGLGLDFSSWTGPRISPHTIVVFISRHNLYEPTYLLNVLAVALTASSKLEACVQHLAGYSCQLVSVIKLHSKKILKDIYIYKNLYTKIYFLKKVFIIILIGNYFFVPNLESLLY